MPEIQRRSPLIRLPEEKRGRIEAKLEEYEARLARKKAQIVIEDPRYAYLAPELMKVGTLPLELVGTTYKIAVAKQLLEAGEVNTWDLSRQLEQRYGRIDVRRFDNACGVLKAYCEGRDEDLAQAS